MGNRPTIAGYIWLHRLFRSKPVQTSKYDWIRNPASLVSALTYVWCLNQSPYFHVESSVQIPGKRLESGSMSQCQTRGTLENYRTIHAKLAKIIWPTIAKRSFANKCAYQCDILLFWQCLVLSCLIHCLQHILWKLKHVRTNEALHVRLPPIGRATRWARLAWRRAWSKVVAEQRWAKTASAVLVTERNKHRM